MQEAVALKLRMEVALEHEVVFQRIIQNEAVLMAILRNMAEPRLVAFADGHVRDVPIVEENLAAVWLEQAGERIDQFALAVAVNARDADDFAAVHVEGDIVDHRLAVLLALDGQVLHRQHAFPRLERRFFHDELHLAANHHLAQFFLAGVGHIDRADVLALAQHGAAIRHGLDLVELVGDEEDGFAFFGQLLHNLHQLFDFLRREHGGRLVENEHLVVAVQHFENLGALLHAHGDILNHRVGVHLEAVALAQLHHLLTRLRLLQKAEGRGRRLHAEDDVVQHRKDVHELKVLVHHADAQCVRVVGVANLHNLPVLANFALFRLIHAEEHAHQGRFARAVFAQQRVDFALSELQGDIVVGDNPRKLLGNMQHFNDILAQSNRSFLRILYTFYYSVFCAILQKLFAFFAGGRFAGGFAPFPIRQKSGEAAAPLRPNG